MNLQTQAPHLNGGWLTDAGSYLGKTTRGILDTAGRVVNIVATRGGADQDTIISEQGAQDGGMADMAMPLAIAGVGVLALIAVMAGKPKKRGR